MMMDIKFSDSEDEEQEESQALIVPAKSIIHSLLSKNQSRLDTITSSVEVLNNKRYVPLSSQKSSNIVVDSSKDLSKQNDEILLSIKENLQTAEEQQNTLLNDVSKVKTKDEFAKARTKYLFIQTLLAEANKTLSKKNKEIKILRESQLADLSQASLTQTDSDSNDRKLVKKAKELIVQQKRLIKLMKVHKEINGALKNIKVATREKTTVSSKHSEQAASTSYPKLVNSERPASTSNQRTLTKVTNSQHVERNLTTKENSNKNKDRSNQEKENAIAVTEALKPVKACDIVEPTCIRLAKKEEFGKHLRLPGNFWDAGFESIDLFNSIMSGEEM